MFLVDGHLLHNQNLGVGLMLKRWRKSTRRNSSSRVGRRLDREKSKV